MKTAELTGAALDWAVAKCEDLDPVIGPHRTVEDALQVTVGQRVVYSPSHNWSQGGPIIERENIGLVCQSVTATGKYRCAECHKGDAIYYYYGPTILIAAMRCYVASKLGDEVDVPEELK